MQGRRTIIALMAAMAAFYVWLYVSHRLFPEAFAPPRPPAEAQSRPEALPAGPESPGDEKSSLAATGHDTAEPTASSTTPSSGEELRIEAGEDSEPVILGGTDPRGPYPMALTVLSQGATVGEARLRDFHKTVARTEPYMICRPVEHTGGSGSLQRFDSFALPKLRFENLRREVRLDGVLWRKGPVTANSAEFSVTVLQPDGRPLARVVRTYSLPEQPPHRNRRFQTYDLVLSNRVENLGSEPFSVILVQRGPVGFHREQSRGEDRRLVSAVWERGQPSGPSARGYYRTDVAKHGRLDLGRDDDEQRIAWVADTNQYFTCIMAPAGRNGFDAPARYEAATGITLTPDVEPGDDLTFTYTSKPTPVAPGGFEAFDFEVYIGPKSKPTFDTHEHYRTRDYYYVIRETFPFCAPAALVGLMMRLLQLFHGIPPHNYGLAIIFLVLVVKGILHPVSKKSQVNMSRMQKQMSVLQPKIKAAQEKYANDRVAMNNAVMEIYREAGVNPATQMLNCLPMMLQIPIWAALWSALNAAVEMRHAPFDGWWIRDLTQPDQFFAFPGHPIHIPLLSGMMGGPITALNLLPILLGISQILQTRYMPRGNPEAAAATGNPDQLEQQRKMMMFMSVFFIFLLYNAPSGLNLYIMASNIFGIIEQWRIRKHMAELEAREASAPPKPAEPRPKSWIQRQWESLQKEAEEARRIQSQRKSRQRT